MKSRFALTSSLAVVAASLLGSTLGSGAAAASPYGPKGFTDGGPSCDRGVAAVVAESALSKVVICRNGTDLQYIGQGLRTQNWLWIDDVRLDGGDTYIATHEKFTYVVRWGTLEIDAPDGKTVSHEHLDMHTFEHD